MKRTRTLFYYIILNIFIAIQEVTGSHPFSASHLELIDLEHIVTSGDVKHTVINHDRARSHAYVLLRLRGLEDLQINRLAVGT